ncbi:protein kinase [Heliobacterium gestii]|uniref:Protein kinase n=1 Tax=Heliomicrobium gestii TaxID=2699 RepID=A0A845L6P9_HELGE|nr:protein kinase [Heliomicrobium gestii]MBM7865648.1 hypothetical protein [Heliomicrobium gestii]MZP41898.1 protein kinase [Heliomicrobium gestii]
MEKTQILPRATEILPVMTAVMDAVDEESGKGQRDEATGPLFSENEPAAEYVTIGCSLKGGYRLTGVIAENTGESSIFIATNGQTERVAKVYHRYKKPKEEIIERIKSIRSPYVIPILEEGEIAGRFFEILPYYKNSDLLKATPLDAAFVAQVVVPQVNAALKAIHQAGIIHRDIKPNNLFFSDDRNSVIVGDFGISSILDDRQSVRLTTASRTLGYSAPETAQGFVSTESDYYSFGVSLLHLITGHDPFLGMTDQQILKVTLTDKLHIPSTVDNTIAQLIRGLTVKEREDRWGYDEVERWCEGQPVPVKENANRVKNIRPYVFNGEEIMELDKLALALAGKWDEAMKHFARGYISEHLLQIGQDLASTAADYEEETNREFGFFKLLYLLNPKAPLCWRGEFFTDLVRLGERVRECLPEINRDYADLLESGALLHFLRTKQLDPAVVDAFARLKERCRTDRNEAYYKMAFLLTGSNLMKWRGQLFDSVDALVGYLHANREGDIDAMAEELVGSKYFYAWLEHLGYGSILKQWRALPYGR